MSLITRAPIVYSLCADGRSGFALARVVISQLQRHSARSYVAAVPATGKIPPTLEEFDPLNPGEWQVGAGGRILPRLPEGTRVGKLVMGKYGLYAPHIRKFQLEHEALYEKGKTKTYHLTEWRRRSFFAYGVVLHILAVYSIICLFTIVHGKPFWPFEGFFRFIGVKWQGMDD